MVSTKTKSDEKSMETTAMPIKTKSGKKMSFKTLVRKVGSAALAAWIERHNIARHVWKKPKSK
jgi:hypothetical protein